MAKKIFRGTSIMKKIILSLTVVLALQACLLLGFILLGGIIERLDDNDLSIMREKVSNRRNYLEVEMLQKWSNTGDTLGEIDMLVDEYLQLQNLSYNDITLANPTTNDLLTSISDPLIDLMRRNVVSGAFIIFNGATSQAMPAGQTTDKAGLYFRDLDPTTFTADNSDLLMGRGSADIARSLNLPLDTSWKPRFELSILDDFYYKTFEAAVEYPYLNNNDLGYWGYDSSLLEDGNNGITYSQPLRNEEGEVYGVYGIELSMDYLDNWLPYSELNITNSNAYLLAVSNADMINSGGERSFITAKTTGPIFANMFGNKEITCFEPQAIYDYSSVFIAQTCDTYQDIVIADIRYLSLYNANTPFADDNWALIGMANQEDIFSFSDNLVNTILVFAMASLAIGFVIAWLAGYFIAKPIQDLAHSVNRLNPNKPVNLERINVREIDELADSIEDLSAEIISASSRLSSIIELADMPMAAYELGKSGHRAYFTQQFSDLIPKENLHNDISRRELNQFLDWLNDYKEDENKNTTIYKVEMPNWPNHYNWIRLKTVKNGEATLGVMMDATAEMLERRKIEYERDYDILTNLLNRRAFITLMEELELEPAKIKIGALVMMDLDNLKHVNDTYGHDLGDNYIRKAAKVLRDCQNKQMIAGRMAGDEFYCFYYGFDNRPQLQNCIDDMRKQMTNALLDLPDGRKIKIRASAGVAWYPDDSQSILELIRYADFAMYEVKHATKGSIKHFDLQSYKKDSFILYSKEELNTIIEEQLIDYAFQPIISALDGKVLGYEALMRPRSTTLTSPADVLRLAQLQSKLYQIERLTWFKSLQSYFSFPNAVDMGLLFINAIPNQTLTDEDKAALDELYQDVFHNCVIELTEVDELINDSLKSKHKHRTIYNSKLAIDDYGSGYNSEATLLSVQPDYVKIDMGLIRDIDHDPNRQQLVSNLVAFCHARQIKVIAEGVENAAELAMLIGLGVDYLQGYYLAKPNLDLIKPSQMVIEQIIEFNHK